jgi:DNA-binding CsgD family transcriptional regulator
MTATVWRRPTRRQLEVLRAYIAAGSIAGAATTLDIAESTARQHLSGLYRRTGCLNVAQAAYLLGMSERRLGLRLVADSPLQTQPTGPLTGDTRAM